MAGLIRYAMFRQDASRVATWSVTGGTPDPAYPVANANGFDVTAPVKLLSTSGILRADLSAFPAYSSLVGVELVHCNLLPGLEVRLQGDNDPAFGSLDANILITIPALKNNWPVNPRVLFSAVDCDYWRINVVGTNPVNISIGHIALLTGVQSMAWAGQEITWRDEIPCWDDETELSVPMDLDLLTQLRACTFDTVNGAVSQAAMDDWWFDARGKMLPFAFIPNVDVNESYWMTFQEKFKEVPTRLGTSSFRIALREFGRGMLPTPWLV